MQCPQCNIKMKTGEVGETIIDECPRCKGIWFDHGELDAVKDEVVPDSSWLGIDEWKQKAEFKVSINPLSCPSCHDISLTTVEDQSSETEINTCTQCKGTWLSAEQFIKLIDEFLKEAYGKSVPEYARISLQQAKELVTRPDSILSEWQDLKSVFKMLKHRLFINNPKLKSLILGLQKSLPL